MRVTVLPLRAFSTAPADLAAMTAELDARLREERDLQLVDPVARLGDRGSEEWLRADHLLYDGIELYGSLRYDDAVTKLKEGLAISDRTFREYGDSQGPRRVRDLCLYLGLARLEQGAEEEADSWFRRAVRTDPAYELDAKQFSPAARAAWERAHRELSGAPMETSLETLSPMAEAIGTDVVVTGGVEEKSDGRVTVQLVIADHRKGVLTEQAVEAQGAAREALLRAVDRAAPQVIARVLGRPVFDEAAIARRVRVHAGLDWTEFDAASIGARAITDRYRWHGRLAVPGAAIAVTGWRSGPVTFLPSLVFQPQQTLARRFSLAPPDATAELQIGLAARLFAMLERRAARTTFAAGPGIEGGYAVFVFRSATSVAPATAAWGMPAAGASVRHDLGRSAAVQAFAGAGYDPLGRAPGRFAWQVQLSAGAAF